jgi:hypothetical protein
MIAVSNLEFLEALFADIPDDAAAMVCGFPGDPYAQGTGKWFARPWCHGKPLPARVNANANTYGAVSSFSRDADGQFRRRKEQFVRFHACMIDDVGSKVPPERLRLSPSARIETSPGNFQDYLFVAPTPAADDAAIAARLLEQLVAQGLTTDGKDPGMRGTTRYGRLPVGVNGKAKVVKALGAPFRTRTVEWSPDRRYTVEQIAAAYALDLTPPKPRIHTPLPAGAVQTRLTQFDALMRILADAGLYLSSRASGWHDIVCPWAGEHTDGSITGSAIHEPADTNGWAGGFKCHHGHCERRSIRNVYDFAREFQKALKGSA